MKKPRKKKTNTVSVPEAYDQYLIAEIEAQLALAREMAGLATELRVYVAQIEQTLRDGRPSNVIRFPGRIS